MNFDHIKAEHTAIKNQPAEPIILQKELIRKQMLEKRLALRDLEVSQLSRLIFANLVTQLYIQNQTVGVYFSIKKEPEIKYLLKYRLRKVALPATEGGRMLFKEWHEEDALEPGKYGIAEPGANAPEVTPQIILVPLLAFDAQGYRIGYGKGYYDKYLANFKGIKIGIAYEFQKIESVPHERHDIPLDFIITESNVYEAEST